MGNMNWLQKVALALPEAQRVDIEEWGGHPTFRVANKNFVFSDTDATRITVKLPKEEAAAVVATSAAAEPAGYGLGRHGWVAMTLKSRLSAADKQEIEEFIETSYRLVAPKRLVRLLDSRNT